MLVLALLGLAVLSDPVLLSDPALWSTPPDPSATGPDLLLDRLWIVLSLAYSATAVYILWALKRLLNDYLRFRRADGILTLLLVLVASGWLLSLAPGEEPLVIGATVGYTLVWLVVDLALALRLLSLPGDLYGLLRTYVYLTIASAACTALVVLLPFGLLGYMVRDGLLAIVFFKAADHAAPAAPTSGAAPT